MQEAWAKTSSRCPSWVHLESLYWPFGRHVYIAAFGNCLITVLHWVLQTLLVVKGSTQLSTRLCRVVHMQFTRACYEQYQTPQVSFLIEWTGFLVCWVPVAPQDIESKVFDSKHNTSYISEAYSCTDVRVWTGTAFHEEPKFELGISLHALANTGSWVQLESEV